MKSCRRFPWVASFALAVTLALSASVSAQTYNVHFRSADVSGRVGAVVTLGIDVANTPQAVTSLSFGVKHDATKLTLESVTLAPEMQAIIGAGNSPDARFYHVDTAPVGGAGFTVGWILGADAGTGISIPAGASNRVFNVRYRIADDAPVGATSVQITGDLGSPKVPVVLDLKGVSQAPAGTPGLTQATVTVAEGPANFLRGDANQSGKYEVTDAILIIDYLFGGGALSAGAPTRDRCLVAMNTDGSTFKGTVNVEDVLDIDLTDAIVVLRVIFPAGSPLSPAVPYPTCGQPETVVDSALECQEFSCK